MQIISYLNSRLKIIIAIICLIHLSISISYSQNLIRNSGFESGLLEPFWLVSANSGPPSVIIDAGNAYEGVYCVQLESDNIFLYQPINLEPNTTYIISATIRTELGDNVLFGISNVNSSGGTSIYFNNINYITETWSFTTDASPGNDPSIYIWKDVGTGIAWVDSIDLRIDTTGNQPDPPGGLATYYISNTGHDNNSGTSPAEAWLTVDKFNQIDFGPGDQIFFKGGDTFNGTIVLNGEDYGTPENKIQISSYGNGRATINAQTGYGLIAYDCSNISIKNLNFVGDGRLNNNNTGNGVIFSYCSNVSVDSLEISGFQHSGLKISNYGNNFNIQNVNANNNGYAGIYIFGMSKTSLSDIYLGYCIADNNPGDPTVTDNHSGNGIFAYNASNIIFEYCEASNNGEDMPWNGNGPGGIWVAEVDNALIQYCISHDNKTPPGAYDGLGFDLDGGTTNSTIQYCLSYNNFGAGYGIFQYKGASEWINNTIRYCISENDGNVSGKGSVIFWNGTTDPNSLQGLEFYNNVVYNANGPALAFLDHRNNNINLRNNIFFSQTNSVHNGINGEYFQGNCWYSSNGAFVVNNVTISDFNSWAQNNNQEIYNGEIVGMFDDPSFINPGNSTIIDPLQLTSVNDYKVNDGSIVIDSGLDLYTLFNIDPGTRDYFGNAIKQGASLDMGVYENPIKQKVIFEPGWNIFSVNNMPDVTDMMSIFQSLIDNSSLIKIQDESGNTVEDWGTYGGWQNNIGDIVITEGYKLKSNVKDSIAVHGFQNSYPCAIPLKTGWNIIGYPQTTAYNGMDYVMQDLINKGILEKVQDEQGSSIEDWGTYGGWQNFIGDFVPGEGYKVKVNANDTLWIYESYPKSASNNFKIVSSIYFQPAFSGNGVNHMNINLVNLSESGISEGDEIGIFDGNICVGAAKISNNLIDGEDKVSIPVSANDGVNLNNGFKENNTVSAKLYKNERVYAIGIVPVNGGVPVFHKNGSLFANIEVTNGIDDDNENVKVNCYPSIFNEEINIQIFDNGMRPLTVKVFDLNGKLIKTLYEGIMKGSCLLKWNGDSDSNKKVISGLYMIMINNKPYKVFYTEK